MRWVRQSWFRHLFTIRPTAGARKVRDNWGGKIGLPHIDYDFDPPHVGSMQVHFTHLWVEWLIGPFQFWLGVKDIVAITSEVFNGISTRT